MIFSTAPLIFGNIFFLPSINIFKTSLGEQPSNSPHYTLQSTEQTVVSISFTATVLLY